MSSFHNKNNTVRGEHTKIEQGNKDFPEKLTHLDQIPKHIYTKGEDLNDLLKQPVVAIVGSRKLTDYGRMVTANITEYLSRRGVVVISGLALGLDSVAHETAIKAGGKTIAVLPSGVDKVYPVSHYHLAHKIIENGALVSEYPGSTLPARQSFIARNRIIAGLSDLVLIPEAGEKSGSLHTARFALELGKTILAVPGSIYSPISVGCNNLIKSGAGLASSGQDVIDALGLTSSQVLPIDSEYQPEDRREELVIAHLKQHGISKRSSLLRATELPINDFQQTLSMLEIKGVVHAQGDNWQLKK